MYTTTTTIDEQLMASVNRLIQLSDNCPRRVQTKIKRAILQTIYRATSMLEDSINNNYPRSSTIH